MRVVTAFDQFHKESMPCDPDLPMRPEGPKFLKREELEMGDYEPCEVCFPNWEEQ